MDSTNIYTPSTLINIYNNSLGVNSEKKLIELEGVYIQESEKGYKGIYYEQLQDAQTEQKIQLAIPKAIRESVETNHIYTFKGYLTRKVTDFSSIRITFNVTNVLSEGKPNNDEEKKILGLKNDRVEKSFKNFRMYIENILLNGNSPKIALFMCDAHKHELYSNIEGLTNVYKFEEFNVNLNSKDELIKAIMDIEKDRIYDAIILGRSGKDDEVYNDTDFLEVVCGIETMIVTVLYNDKGFKYLQSLSDYTFKSIESMANYFNIIYNQILQFKSSRVKIVRNLEKEIADLKKGIKDTNEIAQKNNDEKDYLIKKVNRNNRILLGLLIVLVIIIMYLFIMGRK